MIEPDYMTIAAFARGCGVSPKTLRFYDEIGLFRAAFVDPRTRYRYYSAGQLRDFARLRAMRDGGASLAEIRHMLRARQSEGARRTFLRKLRLARLKVIDESRRSLAWIESELASLERSSGMSATIVYSPPVKVATLRTELRDYAEVHEHERVLLESIAPRFRGLRGVLWHRCADRGVIDAEPFVAIDPRDRRARARVAELPGAHVARVFSSFDDGEAEEAHLALSQWIHDRGFRRAGPRREIYRGPLLEIQHPLG